MDYIRWVKMSEALARLGHQVDLATRAMPALRRQACPLNSSNVRRVKLRNVNWRDYDVVKTLFNEGFSALDKYGGIDHPFIISKLGSVVGPRDMDGIYFSGQYRQRLYDIQCAISSSSRYVAVLSKPAADLWVQCHGTRTTSLLVPGAADAEIPSPGRDPYPSSRRPRCIFAGHLYNLDDQPEANRVLVDKLNILGGILKQSGVRLYFLGTGNTRRLDSERVTHLGRAPYLKSWNYLHHADVGLVVAAGTFMHNNESTKIYHYLRAGLPVVSESGFPNDYVVADSGLGIVAPNGDPERIAEMVLAAVDMSWDSEAGIRYILKKHTWDIRARIYDRVIREQFG